MARGLPGRSGPLRAGRVQWRREISPAWPTPREILRRATTDPVGVGVGVGGR